MLRLPDYVGYNVSCDVEPTNRKTDQEIPPMKTSELIDYVREHTYTLRELVESERHPTSLIGRGRHTGTGWGDSHSLFEEGQIIDFECYFPLDTRFIKDRDRCKGVFGILKKRVDKNENHPELKLRRANPKYNEETMLPIKQKSRKHGGIVRGVAGPREERAEPLSHVRPEYYWLMDFICDERYLTGMPLKKRVIEKPIGYDETSTPYADDFLGALELNMYNCLKGCLRYWKEDEHRNVFNEELKLIFIEQMLAQSTGNKNEDTFRLAGQAPSPSKAARLLRSPYKSGSDRAYRQTVLDNLDNFGAGTEYGVPTTSTN